MNILILGANGQIGHELDRSCRELGQCTALTRVAVDFSRPGDITRVMDEYRPDVVINAIAYTAVDKAESEPSLAMLVNAVAVQELAISCSQHGAWCIHYSTDYVFDGSSNQPYKETDPVSPLGIYGQTKLAGEAFIVKQLENYLILRTSWVYSWRGSNFVKTMLRLAGQKQQLKVVNDQFGSPTYAVDIAQATADMVAHIKDRRAPAGIYHMSGSQPASWYEFAAEIFAQADRSIEVMPVPTAEFPTPAKRPAYSLLDNSKLEQTFGIVLPGYKDSLKHCLSRMALV